MSELLHPTWHLFLQPLTSLTLFSVTPDVRYAGPAHFQDGDRFYTTFGFRTKAMVNRENFGILRNLELGKGGFMVGKHLFLTSDTEADLISD